MLAKLKATPEYRDWQWDLAQRMRNGLEAVYSKQPDELKCVGSLLTEIGKTSSVRAKQAPNIRVDVDSAYLHDHRSQVKFSVAGVEHQREIADLLVLGSFVENNSLKWQRVCFVQAKKEQAARGVKHARARFNVDEWQLCLLRTFPAFTGVLGFFDGLSGRLRNHSGMLGAYGLLSAPGDFSVVSARVLYTVLGGRTSFMIKDLLPATLSEVKASPQLGSAAAFPWWPLDPDHCPECRDIIEHLWPFPWREMWRHKHQHFSHMSSCHSGLDVFPEPTRLTCLGLDEFVDAWTSLRLGEIWEAGSTAKSDTVLRDFLLAVISRVSAATGSLGQIRAWIASSSGMPLERNNADDLPLHQEDKGLVVLSTVVTSGGEE